MSCEIVYPWFALQVRTGGEHLVETALRRKFYETLLPTYKEYRQYSDRIRKVDSPLFPGYLFCRLNPDQRLPVLITPGVYDIVRCGDKLQPVDESEVDAIRRVMEAGCTAKPWHYLKAGDKVRVAFGSLAGVEGLMVQEKGEDRLVLSITILQRSVAVTVERSWIQPVSPLYRVAGANG